MKIENQGNAPMINELIGAFMARLDDILKRLERIERNQSRVREVIEDASPPPQGSFGSSQLS